jgi:hypothetical protein
MIYDAKEKVYGELNTLITSVPNNGKLIDLGNFNARMCN